jgi:hypothetical protein
MTNTISLRSRILSLLAVVSLITLCYISDRRKMAMAEDKPPQIGADLRAKFWRVQFDLTKAQKELDTQNAKAKAVYDELVTSCGEFTLIGDPQGEPICGARKPAPKPPEKSKEGAGNSAQGTANADPKTPH